MKSVIALAVLMFMLDAPTKAADSLVLGAGVANCASMLTTPTQRDYSTSWILGYWTGTNSILATTGRGTGMVGSKMSARSIVDAVTLVCTQNPGYTLFDAAAIAFIRVAGSEH